jgi:hypothetical protein
MRPLCISRIPRVTEGYAPQLQQTLLQAFQPDTFFVRMRIVLRRPGTDN